ncbi:MAG: TonB-dependent receptor [Bryobacterales bacterium]|nr:TonB-dependent receptor [Bryobacterales bacterium]
MNEAIKKKIPYFLLGFLLCACALEVPVLAQTTSTEILGTVTDASGAVVPGATVVLLRVATGERRETTTGPTGDFSFPLIEIGEYTVTVQLKGFQTQTQSGIMLQLQQRARVNFQLAVGETTETVEVVASGIQLKTEDAAVGQVVDNKRVVELPLNGRNVASLAVLTAGVQYGQRMGFDGQAGFPIPGNSVAISANGQREVNQQVTLDGVIATEPRVNTTVFTPSIDAIEEFKVQTSSYSAEYGQNNGAIVQIALKSGTNQLRGTLFEFLRNDKLAATDYFLNFQVPQGSKLSEKNRLRRNQFGFFLGGPVTIPKVYDGKDRTFWSFTYEGRRETRETVQTTRWHPQADRNGDFSAYLTPLIVNGVPIRQPSIIYDPTTGEPYRDNNGKINNIIPASRINKNAQAFVNQFQPLPMFNPVDVSDNNAQGTVPNIYKTNQYFWRIDHQLTSKDKMFVRFAIDRSKWDNYDLNPNFTYYVLSKATNIAYQWIRIFSPRMLNEFRYGLNKASDDTRNPRTDTDFDMDSLNIGKFRVATDNNRKFTTREVGIPSTLIGGDRDGGNGYDFNTVHQFTDNVSMTLGSHTFKTGIEYRYNILDRAAANSARGSASGSLQDFLLGYYSSSATGEGLPFTAPRQSRYSAYFLDDWKVTRKLTANIGLRWDYFGRPVDVEGGWRSFRPDILTQASDGRMLPTLIPGPNVTNYVFSEVDNRYFMPRVGLAYRLTEKWVIRSGAGWFANAQQFNNWTILALLPPRSGQLTFSSVTDVAQTFDYAYGGKTYTVQTRKYRPNTPIITLDNVFPGSGTAPARRALSLFPYDNKSPNTWQWSFDLQRNLPWNLLMTVAYVGSKSSHVDATITQNLPGPSPDTNIDARRPWQAYVSQGEGNAALGLGNIRFLEAYANGSYQGLQTTVEKRYSHGLTMSLAYTYSKALGEGYGRNEGSGNTGTFQDWTNRRASRTRYGFDVTHNAVFNFVYDMPFLDRFKGVTGAFIGGWQVNGIVTMRTGFPFGLTGGDINTGQTTRPDRIADGRLGDAATRQKWFDPSAFRRVSCNIPGRLDLCHYGSAGDGIMVSPGASNLDLSLYKNWKMPFLGEQGRLQFRSEFFNFSNTPQFGVPNGLSFSTTTSIVPDGPRMGEIRSLRLPMRVIQFGLKLYF